MKRLWYILLFISVYNNGAVRNIFQYDNDWNYVDYDIVAHGIFHDTGKVFKVLQCGAESKIVIEKK